MTLSRVEAARPCKDEIRRLLVEGFPVEIGGRTMRVYPSVREVARSQGVHWSRISRMVKRERVGEARRAQLAADQRAAVAMPALTIERLVREAVGGLAAECWAGRRQPTAAEQRVMAELAAWGRGEAIGSRKLVGRLARIRQGAVRRRGGRS